MSQLVAQCWVVEKLLNVVIALAQCNKHLSWTNIDILFKGFTVSVCVFVHMQYSARGLGQIRVCTWNQNNKGSTNVSSLNHNIWLLNRENTSCRTWVTIKYFLVTLSQDFRCQECLILEGTFSLTRYNPIKVR